MCRGNLLEDRTAGRGETVRNTGGDSQNVALFHPLYLAAEVHGHFAIDTDEGFFFDFVHVFRVALAWEHSDDFLAVFAVHESSQYSSKLEESIETVVV